MSRVAQSTPVHDSLAFLASGGEMAECIRAFDRSKPPLGPAPFWSPVIHASLLKVSVIVSWRFAELRGDVPRAARRIATKRAQPTGP